MQKVRSEFRHNLQTSTATLSSRRGGREQPWNRAEGSRRRRPGRPHMPARGRRMPHAAFKCLPWTRPASRKQTQAKQSSDRRLCACLDLSVNSQQAQPNQDPEKPCPQAGDSRWRDALSFCPGESRGVGSASFSDKRASVILRETGYLSPTEAGENGFASGSQTFDVVSHPSIFLGV